MPRHTDSGAYRSPREFFTELGCSADEPVLLGLSGGSDSVSLLDMLLKDGINVCAAHLNHGIRGDEAERDLTFCRKLCESRGVRLFDRTLDVPAEAERTGEGLEEAARRLRYAFFADIMKNEGIRFLCTAHNADDNAETLLFNLTRGTSPKGACGIPEQRPFENGFVIRPILRVSKAEILNYCKNHSLEYVIDSTNADTDYSRNRIRANVIPELKLINPGLVTAVSSFCEAERRDSDCLDSMALDFLKKTPAPTGRVLSTLHPAVSARVLMILCRENGASPEHGHIDTLLEGVYAHKRTGVSLPGGIIATVPPSRPVQFRKEERKKDKYNGETIMYNMNDDIERVLLTEEDIDAITTKVAAEIDRAYDESERKLLLLSILKGSVVFMGDIMKKVKRPCEIDFMKVSSYTGTESRGKVDIILDLRRDHLEDTDVVIVEDIVDSGNTLAYLSDYLRLKGVNSVKCAAMLDKPSRRQVNFNPDFIGKEIPDLFVVGYGLDYDEKYRNLPYIGILKPEVYSK